MCGILTILSAGPVEEARMRAGLGAIEHRGPDDLRLWRSKDERVALGHVRLAIVDVEGGEQPIKSEDGEVVAVVNGEFYDDERIRRSLRRRGHRFRSCSDSEILVHLYEERGVECLEELRGEFAFVLWDARKKRLFAARDRFGVKPLCWAKRSEGVSLASEAKALLATGVSARWDVDAFLAAAHHHYTPPAKTLFEGVAQLRPGHFLVASGGAVKVEKYWDIEVDAARGAVSAEELRASLEESVRLRMRADVKVGCYLSGGLDSSAVAAMAAKFSGEPLQCFGVGFEDGVYDERYFAEEVAAHIGAEFHPVVVGSGELLENLEGAVFQSEGLAINGHLPAKFLLSKAVRDAGVKVVLTGEGADEALLGYPHFRVDLLGGGDEELMESNVASQGVMLPAGEMLDVDGVRGRLGFVPTFLKAKAGLGHRVVGCLDEDFWRSRGEVDYYDRLLDSFDVGGFAEGQRVEQSAYLWSRLALANYILRTLGDGTEMAHSVEGRTPFLDHHFYELCSRIPVGVKIKDGVEKWILREAVKELLPASIVGREKHPFLAPPMCLWGEFVQDIFRSTSMEKLPFFDRGRLLLVLDKMSWGEVEQRLWEPVVMTALSAILLGESMGLEVGA